MSLLWLFILCTLLAGSSLIDISPAEVLSESKKTDLQSMLDREIIGPHQAMADAQAYIASRVLPLPMFQSVPQWERYANRIREDMLERVIFRGEAAAWRDARTRVDWLETIPGGPGYRIRKLRYEALPGMWIPALLYEPENLVAKVPVILNVMGHESDGMVGVDTQIRCINEAKRGMLALNVEWFGMGQLQTENFDHYRMNQIDLSGTSGIAVFYLSLKRAIDLLLSLEHADPRRVAVTGLSSGGWQALLIGALDTRVQLINSVAGFSSYLTRAEFLLDLGDSEDTAPDLATVADSTHLTALMAPRSALLTYNAKDQCCFRPDYALDPLLDAARPVFKLYEKSGNLRYHINYDPGTHNYKQDNREAFYRMIGDFFYSASPSFKWQEFAVNEELKTKEEYQVDLPMDNLDFHTLALELSKHLPRHQDLPTDKASGLRWQKTARAQLRQVVRAKQFQLHAEKVDSKEVGDLKVTYWRLRMDNAWTVPAVELARGEPRSTSILVADDGRASVTVEVQRLLDTGNRVVAVDPFYFGESKIEDPFHREGNRRSWSSRATGIALFVDAVGDRVLGLQASQLTAVARWLHERDSNPVSIVAVGSRASLFSLVGAGLEDQAIKGLRLHNSMGSLKEVIEQNRTALEVPELFCFGLLEAFDIKQLIALVAPRPVQLVGSSERAKMELSALREWYALTGVNFDRLK